MSSFITFYFDTDEIELVVALLEIHMQWPSLQIEKHKDPLNSYVRKHFENMGFAPSDNWYMWETDCEDTEVELTEYVKAFSKIKHLVKQSYKGDNTTDFYRPITAGTTVNRHILNIPDNRSDEDKRMEQNLKERTEQASKLKEDAVLLAKARQAIGTPLKRFLAERLFGIKI